MGPILRSRLELGSRSLVSRLNTYISAIVRDLRLQWWSFSSAPALIVAVLLTLQPAIYSRRYSLTHIHDERGSQAAKLHGFKAHDWSRAWPGIRRGLGSVWSVVTTPDRVAGAGRAGPSHSLPTAPVFFVGSFTSFSHPEPAW